MDTEENLHKGHRQRMFAKFNNNSNLFADHELLETLLYYVIPRQDTNPLAHRLLLVFGNLNRLFSATKQELLTVKGVGEKTAEFITLVGALTRRTNVAENKDISFLSVERALANLQKEFRGLATERCVIILLDGKHNRLARLCYESKAYDKVDIDMNDLVSAFAIFHPAYMIISHNHVINECYPSSYDDATTRKICLLGMLHGVNLIEHYIFKGEAYYSYNADGKLENIKKLAEIDYNLNLGGEVNE